ncbi:FAD-binding protein [Thermodesulfobacteriota bacterium]
MDRDLVALQPARHSQTLDTTLKGRARLHLVNMYHQREGSMLKPAKTMETDVVIAGSGPGGATAARDLSRSGKKVIVCEAGKEHRRFEYTPFLLSMMDGWGFTFSEEGEPGSCGQRPWEAPPWSSAGQPSGLLHG